VIEISVKISGVVVKLGISMENVEGKLSSIVVVNSGAFCVEIFSVVVRIGGSLGIKVVNCSFVVSKNSVVVNAGGVIGKLVEISG
jgi:hypothetical protein